MLKLRPWQQIALSKSLKWLVDDRSDKHFLVNAAPGAGKTLMACALAKELISRDEIDRVIVIAPRNEVVNQWSDDFKWVTGRFMGKVTAGDGDISELGTDVCATWSAVQGLQDALQAVCQRSRVLIICDEHHHAAIEAVWGKTADSAFSNAAFSLILTGTPVRSDGAKSVWLNYNSMGGIDHPEEGSYTLTYGEAVDLGYCRPVTFHRHEGKFTVDLDDGSHVNVSGQSESKLPKDIAKIPGLQRALNFYRLACTPQYEVDNSTPLSSGNQTTMVDWASSKLNELRHRMPEAGGLVIAPNIEMAEYMVKVIELVEGEKPMLVHSNMPNPEAKIRAFRNTDKRWLVSVSMVSEGVDIKRLRVLLYLPNATTELYFRQAIGRVVRTYGPEDDTRAYVVMPSFDIFEDYARKIEDEMPPSTLKESSSKPKLKRCPKCHAESALSATGCSECGHEFGKTKERFKSCPDCSSLNPLSATSCHACGSKFSPAFVLTLDEALRNGAIVRGMDIDEKTVQESEEIAPKVRNLILKSGDDKLLKVIKTLPDESMARLRDILSN